MSFWDTFMTAAEKAGEATKLAGHKAKLNAEILMVDRQINQRQHKFGRDLYAYLSPLTASTDFYASNDKLTNVIRPPLITAQKEVAALQGKQRLVQEQINMAEVQRQSAFHTPAQTWGGKMKNAGKSASMAGTEAKLHTELAVTNTKMTHIQQEFGILMYQRFEQLEDKEGWLPTNREIRNLYDTTRQDIDKIQRSKLEKQQELEHLGGPRAPPPKTTFMETPAVVVQQTHDTPNNNNNNTHGTSPATTTTTTTAADADTMSTFTASTFTQSTPPTPTGGGNGFASHNTTNYNHQTNNYSSTSTTTTTTSMNGFPASSSQQQQQSQPSIPPNNHTNNNNNMTQAQGIFAGVPGAGSYPQEPQQPQPQSSHHDPFSGTTSTNGFPPPQQQSQQQFKKDPFQNNDDLISWDYD